MIVRNKEERNCTCSIWRKYCNSWLFLFNLLLAVFNVWLLCTNAPRSPFVKLDFDYMGVIVAVLGVLLSVLVAWNIYSVVDFRGGLKDVKDTSKQIREEFVKNTMEQNVRAINDKIDIFNYVADLTDVKDNRNGFFAMVKFGLSIIRSLSVLGTHDQCSSMITTLDSIIKDNPYQFQLGKEQKDELLDLLSSVRPVFPRDKYEDLYDKINGIDIDENVRPLIRVKCVVPKHRINGDAPYGFYSWE